MFYHHVLNELFAFNFSLEARHSFNFQAIQSLKWTHFLSIHSEKWHLFYSKDKKFMWTCYEHASEKSLSKLRSGLNMLFFFVLLLKKRTPLTVTITKIKQKVLNFCLMKLGKNLFWHENRRTNPCHKIHI